MSEYINIFPFLEKIINEGEFGYAIEILNKLIAAYPNQDGAFNFRGIAKSNLGDYAGALEDYSMAFMINGNIDKAVVLANRAACKTHLKDYVGALEDSNQAIKLNPNLALAYVNRAFVLSQLQQFEDVLKDCNQAIILNADYALAYAFRSGAYLYLRNYKRAIADCDIAIRINRTEEMAFFNRASAKYQLKYYEEAIEDCKKHMELLPNYVDDYILLARIYYQWEKEIEKVICCYRIAAKLDPENADILFNVANIYAEWETLGILDEAFLSLIGPHRNDCEKFYVDKQAYTERKKIARGFYEHVFVNLLPFMRTDIDKKIDQYTFYLFVGNSQNLLSPLENRAFWFSNPFCFTDKTDCPLLHPINQSKLIVQTSYQNVRIRCLCDPGVDGVENCISVWDRYCYHSGLAYKLTIKKEWLIHNSIYTGKIKYADTNKIGEESPEQVIQDGLFTKSSGYCDEREWRMIKFGQFGESNGMLIPWEYDKKVGVEVQSVYFGINVKSDICKKVIAKAQLDNFDVYQMELTENGKLKSIRVI